VGVMMTPVTSPVMSAFFFLLSVPRALRVAAALAAAAARVVTTATACTGVYIFPATLRVFPTQSSGIPVIKAWSSARWSLSWASP